MSAMIGSIKECIHITNMHSTVQAPETSEHQ
jgi:hypothetical protein